MKILICVETIGGAIDPLALELLSAARAIAGPGDEVVALVAGDGAMAGATLGGADRVVASPHPTAETMTAEVYGRILRQVVEQESPDAILVGYTALGLDVAPHLAGRTGYPLVAYVTALGRSGDTVTAVSQIYGGKLVAESESPLPAVFMINPGRFAETPAAALAADRITTLSPVPLDGLKVRPLREDVPDGKINLAAAERIVCVGRGIGEEGNIEIAKELADLLDAEVAGSRPVIDNGWLPKPRQVGKSGQKVKPKLYLALGVSGAPEHLEGMGSSDLIVAINTDPTAPIFDVAHYGATCDLFDLLPILSEGLKTSTGL